MLMRQRPLDGVHMRARAAFNVKPALRRLELNFSGVCRSWTDLFVKRSQVQMMNGEGNISMKQNKWRGCGRGVGGRQRPTLPLSRHKFHFVSCFTELIHVLASEIRRLPVPVTWLHH